MIFRKLPLALSFACAIASPWAFANTDVSPAPITTQKVDFQQIRNATVKITYGDTTFLIDPMLAKKGTYPGFENTYRSDLRNPMVDLTESPAEVIAGVDAVILHTRILTIGTMPRRKRCLRKSLYSPKMRTMRNWFVPKALKMCTY